MIDAHTVVCRNEKGKVMGDIGKKETEREIQIEPIREPIQVPTPEEVPA
jgi:hypothetical protein